MGSWVSPEQPGDLSVQVLNRSKGVYQIRSELKFTLTEDAAALVDAGVPLQVRYVCRSPRETTVLTRTLRSDLGNRLYIVTDSIENRPIKVKKEGNIFVAARQFKGVVWLVDTVDTRIEFSAEIVPVIVPRLERTVDMSPLFGGRKFGQTLVIDRNSFKK